MSALPLAGLRVLVTRPAPQAGGLVIRLEGLGAQVTTLPLLCIVPSRDPLAAQQALRAHADAYCWIFTSVNAVESAQRLQPDHWPQMLFALGQATVRALAAHGHKALAPEGGSSEDLLLWPELADLKGRRLLIVTGEGGRQLLAETLRQRGARVALAQCYRRDRVVLEATTAAAALAASEVIVLTSGEALQALLAVTEAATLPALLLPSERVAAQARAAGVQAELLLPTAVSDAAIAARLEQWRRAIQNGPL